MALHNDNNMTTYCITTLRRMTTFAIMLRVIILIAIVLNVVAPIIFRELFKQSPALLD